MFGFNMRGSGSVQTEYVSFKGRLAPSTSPIKNILVPKYTGEKIVPVLAIAYLLINRVFWENISPSFYRKTAVNESKQ